MHVLDEYIQKKISVYARTKKELRRMCVNYKLANKEKQKEERSETLWKERETKKTRT